MPFEDALAALEKVVERLESGEMTLDESLALYEEGIHLVRHCTEKLDAAEKTIAMLVEEEGAAVLKPMAAEEESV